MGGRILRPLWDPCAGSGKCWGTYLFDGPVQLVFQGRHNVLGTQIDVLCDKSGGKRNADVEDAIVGRVSSLTGEDTGNADEVGFVPGVVRVLLVVFPKEYEDALRAGQLLTVDDDVGAPFATGCWCC